MSKQQLCSAQAGVRVVVRTLNMLMRPWGGMPMPVSATLTDTISGSAGPVEADTMTRPSAGVNLIALLSRLCNICRNRSGSPAADGGHAVNFFVLRSSSFLTGRSKERGRWWVEGVPRRRGCAMSISEMRATCFFLAMIVWRLTALSTSSHTDSGMDSSSS
jgi:hypothetical protein